MRQNIRAWGEDFYSLLRTKTDSWFWIFVVLVVAQGSDLSITRNVSGLDGSWWMLTTESARTHQIATGGFIGSYGPLGFLDFSLTYWKLGLILDLIWKVAISLAIYVQLRKLLFQIRPNKSWVTSLESCVVVSSTFYFLPPSQMSVLFIVNILWIYILTGKTSTLKTAAYLGVSCGFLFLIKVYPSSLAVAFAVTVLLLDTNKSKLRIQKAIKKLLTFVFFFCCTSFIILLVSGFSLPQMQHWLYGYWQMTSGYKAMAIEDSLRWWEYFVFIALASIVFWRLHKFLKNMLPLTTFLVSLLLLFYYGFNRHDGHSISPFTFLVYLIYLFFVVIQSGNNLPILILSVLVLMAVSGFAWTSILDFSGRTQSSLEYLKVVNSGYVAQLQYQNIQFLQTTYPMSSEIRSDIGNHAVAIFPWDQLAAKAWGLDLVYPPAAQLITAYTPWLDEQNVKWITSNSSPKFLLFSNPKSIDLRDPHWDSPKFQLYVVCNYRSVASDSQWVLLQRRTSPVCNFNNASMQTLSPAISSGSSVFTLPTSERGIVYIDISKNITTMERVTGLFFKPIRTPFAFVDGQRFRVIPGNENYLMTSVPKSIDFISPYGYGQNTTLSLPLGSRITAFTVPVELPRVKR